ncbi:hypothetical protein [Nocardia altamirensis]|uniref:hypothetical protein n=1 Tax=Nocardia altamirensis TaxID=472158 RepID=UPI00114C8982|nr:hypothetical protein [Nocardia altamirensis]
MRILQRGIVAVAMGAVAMLVGNATAAAAHPPLTISPFLWNWYHDSCLTDTGNGGVEMRQCQWESDIFTDMIASQRWGELSVRTNEYGHRVVQLHNGRGQCLNSTYNGAGARITLSACVKTEVRQHWTIETHPTYRFTFVSTSDNVRDSYTIGSEDGRDVRLKSNINWGDQRKSMWDLH